LCREWELALWHGLARPLLGYAYSASGRVAEALSVLDQAPKLVAGEGLATLFVPWAAEGYLLAGHIDEAMRLATRALDFAREHNGRGCETASLRLQADMRRCQGRISLEENAAAYDQALSLAEACGMRPFIAHCHFGLGKLYDRTGDRQRAAEYLATATTMYREMGMIYWLEQAEAMFK
jgi:tetratricopeptide (TPR) repeat protein